MGTLSNENCVPVRRGDSPLSDAQVSELIPQVPNWKTYQVDGIKRLVREFKFKDFSRALDFTNRVGELAEREDHHPSLLTEWGKVTVTWWTHAVSGLHRNDFIMAASSDVLYEG